MEKEKIKQNRKKKSDTVLAIGASKKPLSKTSIAQWNIWDNVFKNGPLQLFLKAVFHRFSLAHFWIHCPILTRFKSWLLKELTHCASLGSLATATPTPLRDPPHDSNYMCDDNEGWYQIGTIMVLQYQVITLKLPHFIRVLLHLLESVTNNHKNMRYTWIVRLQYVSRKHVFVKRASFLLITNDMLFQNTIKF